MPSPWLANPDESPDRRRRAAQRHAPDSPEALARLRAELDRTVPWRSFVVGTLAPRMRLSMDEPGRFRVWITSMDAFSRFPHTALGQIFREWGTEAQYWDHEPPVSSPFAWLWMGAWSGPYNVVWTSREHLTIVSVVEGDLGVVLCDTPEAFAERYEHARQFYEGSGS